MDKQMQKNIIIFFIMLSTIGYFFSIPIQSFTCDRTKNVCMEKSTMPLIGIVQKAKTFKLSDIHSARTEYNSYKTSSSSRHGRSRHNSTNSTKWMSKLILETTAGDIQIFNTNNSSDKVYEKECLKIKQFLASNEQILNIKYSNTLIYILLVLLFLVESYALFRKSE